MTTNEGEGSGMITSLPLDEATRAKFIDCANSVFENVVERIDPQNEDLLRSLWDAENYVDNDLLEPSMLPISVGYSMSLIEAFLWHHVVSLAVATDKEAGPEGSRPNASAPHRRGGWYPVFELLYAQKHRSKRNTCPAVN